MIRDEDGLLTGYVYIDLATSDYGSYVDNAQRVLDRQLKLPAGYTLKWSGEYEFQLRARKRLMVILPIVFLLIFVLLYMLFQSVTEAIVLILPTVYAMTGGLLLQYMMGFNFSVAVWVGYIALFGIAVETGVVMVIYLHEALNRHIAAGELTHEGIELAVIEGAVQRGVFVARILELYHAKWNAIDEKHDVRPAVGLVLDKDELVHGKPIVGVEVFKSDKPRVVAADGAVGMEEVHGGDEVADGPAA